MFAFTLLVQKRVSDAQKRVDNAGLFDHIWRPHPFDPAGEEALAILTIYGGHILLILLVRRPWHLARELACHQL
jgi:hypothetical protein